MPTVLNKDGFRFMIYTHDHPPAHVHIWRQGDEAVIEIQDGIRLRGGDTRMGRNDLARATRIVEEHHETFLKEWRRIHEQI